jgi:DNA-binding winged helix-turn-helix (wHTH) protein
MPTTKDVRFGRFRLDIANERLWNGSAAITLRPKAFAVLTHLVEHAGQLVTKQQLLEAVWPSTFVSDAVLQDSVKQLREALDDDAASPQFIETAHRRGYRFIARISTDTARPNQVSKFSRGPETLQTARADGR